MNIHRKINGSLSFRLPGKIRYFLMVLIGSAALFTSGIEPATEFFPERNIPSVNTVNIISQFSNVNKTPEAAGYFHDKKPAPSAPFKPEGSINTDITERQFSRPPPSL